VSADLGKLTNLDFSPGGYPPGAEPFLAALVTDPGDDTPRLVFADWPGLRTVRLFHLPSNTIDPAGKELIARSPNAQSLTDFVVR
jgi:hypothetical protein